MKVKVYLTNAFSLNMLSAPNALLMVKEITLEQVKKLIQHGFESAIGHESTAQLLSQLLGLEVKVNRTMVKLGENTILVVFQLLTRLPEGKVLTREELEALVREGKTKFFVVYLVKPRPIYGRCSATPYQPEVEKILRTAGIEPEEVLVS